MALNVGNLVAYLQVDDSQFTTTMAQSESRWSKFGGMLGKTALAVGAAGAAAIGAAGSIGVKTAAQMEQAQIGFTTMLGSAEAAQSFLSDLSAFAAKTPFEFPELQTAASSLVSAGVEASKVIPIMTSLGNATSGMGTGSEGVQRATVALQQMNAAGKITAEDLNQLRDAGIPVYDLLAAATGKSKEAVADLAAKGKLGREELGQLMTALENGTGLERFTGLMEKQSASLNGMWSTLKDTFSTGMATAIQPLIPMIKDGLGGATTFVAGAMPKLASGLAQVTGWAQLAYGILFKNDYQGGLIAGIQEDSRAVDILFDIREAALGVYNILFKGDFSGPFLGLQEDSRTVDILFRIREAALSVFAAIRTGDPSELSAGFAAIVAAGQQLGPILGDALSVFQSITSILPSFSTIVSTVASVMGFLADHSTIAAVGLTGVAVAFGLFKVAAALANVVALASLPIQAAQVASNFALAAAIRGAGTASTTSAAQQVASAGLVQASSLRMAATAVATAARVVGGWVLMGVQSLAQAARMAAAWFIALGPIGWVTAAIIAIAALVIANWDKVSSWTKKAWSAVSSAVSGAARAVIGFVTGMASSVLNSIKSAWSSATSAVSGAWSSMTSAVSSGVSSVVGFVRGLPGQLVGALGNVGSILVNAGKSVIDGFLNGIKNGFQAVKNTLSNLTSLLPDWKGPAPRDAVILQDAGRLVMSGFENGLVSKFGDVKRTLGGLTDSLSPTVAVGSGGASRAAPAGPRVMVQHDTIVQTTGDPNAIARAIEARNRDSQFLAGV